MWEFGREFGLGVWDIHRLELGGREFGTSIDLNLGAGVWDIHGSGIGDTHRLGVKERIGGISGADGTRDTHCAGRLDENRDPSGRTGRASFCPPGQLIEKLAL